jgi:hypothetical protein
MTETYPNITWAVESEKVFDGDDFSKGTASMARAMEAGLQGMEVELAGDEKALKQIRGMRQWLAGCLYSANMNNFKTAPPSEPASQPPA